MRDFKVKLAPMRSEADQCEEMAEKLAKCHEELISIKNDIRFRIAQRDRIEKRLNTQSSALEEERKKMATLAGKLYEITDAYERTESLLADMEFVGSHAEKSEEAKKEVPGRDIKWSFFKNSSDFVKNGDYGDLGEKTIGKLSSDNKLKKFADKYNDTFSDPKNRTEYEKFKGEYDFRTGKKTETDLNDKDAVKEFDEQMKAKDISTSIKIASIGGTLFKDAIASGEAIAGSEDGTHASVKAAFLQGTVEAEAYGGLYRVDPKTGEASFKPGVGAKIGASGCVFTAEEEAQLGNKWLGGYLKSDQTLGKVGVEGEINVGFWDKEGKFNPSLYGGAEAEAILGEVSGAAGVKVLGTDVGLEGSVGVGAGIHANAGFQDGKLSVDVGAYVGVGGSVSLEIDVSGTVEAVCDGAKAAWDTVTDWLT